METVEDVAFVDNYLSTKGNDNNKRIKILACIESAKAIMNLKEICQAPRVDGLIVRNSSNNYGKAIPNIYYTSSEVRITAQI